MTNAQDELRRLTSNKAAQENEAMAGRSNFRSPILDWDGRVADITGPYTESIQGRQVSYVTLVVEDLVVRRAKELYQGGSQGTFKLNLPTKANLNSEIGQMVASAITCDATVDSLLDLIGKRVSCTEAVHTFMGRQPANRNDPKGDWVDAEFHTYYYHVNSIGGGAKQNGSALANPEAITAAIQFASGKTRDEFEQSVLRDLPAAAQDSNVRTMIIEGKFLQAAVDNGALVEIEGVYTAV